MFRESKGYLLIESMVSIALFITVLYLGNTVILRAFKYNTIENFEKIEVNYIFFDNLYRSIKMLDIYGGIEVKGNTLILKDKGIKTKYEYTNGYIYVSSSKYKKKIVKCDGIKFLYKNNILEIYLEYKGETVVRMIYI